MSVPSFLNDWKIQIKKLSKSRKGLALMAIICFLEPIFLPIIPELIIAPILIARKSEWPKILLIAISATVLGTIVTYSLAGLAGNVVLTYMSASTASLYESGLLYLHKYGFLLPLIGSFTPFPLKVITWTCGITRFNGFVLISGVFLGRLARYSLIVLLQKTHAHKDRIRIKFNPRRMVISKSFREERA